MNERTIVITGGSSGIGLATALGLARPGINLVLMARGKKALEDAARQCRDKGATVLAISGDVSKENDILIIAQETVRTFGGFDVWINNAGVISFGGFLDFSSEQFEQVLRINVLGTMYGARAALSHFREKNYGTLINIASGLGAFPIPFASPYVTSKYAVRGLSASLRQELQAEGRREIRVTTVLLGTIDTPIYQRSANTTGKAVKALSPGYSAAKAATAIIHAIDHPRAEIVVGESVGITKYFYGLFPAAAEKVLAWYAPRHNYKDKKAQPSSGNLFSSQTSSKAVVSGGWQTSPNYLKRLLPLLGISMIFAILLRSRRGHNNE